MPINILMPALAVSLILGGIPTAAFSQNDQSAGVGQTELAKKPKSEQTTILGLWIKDTTQTECSPSAVGQTSGSSTNLGVWVVTCSSGADFMVFVPGDGEKVPVVATCTQAKKMGLHCYGKL